MSLDMHISASALLLVWPSIVIKPIRNCLWES
jgi:hypothetical protein